MRRRRHPVRAAAAAVAAVATLTPLACASDPDPQPGDAVDDTVPTDTSEPAEAPANADDTGTRTDTTRVELTEDEVAEIAGVDPDAEDPADDDGSDGDAPRELTCLDDGTVLAITGGGSVELDTNLAGDSPVTYECRHVVPDVGVIGYSIRGIGGRLATSTGVRVERPDLGDDGVELREVLSGRCLVSDGTVLVEAADDRVVGVDGDVPGVGDSCAWADAVIDLVADTT